MRAIWLLFTLCVQAAWQAAKERRIKGQEDKGRGEPQGFFSMLARPTLESLQQKEVPRSLPLTRSSASFAARAQQSAEKDFRQAAVALAEKKQQ